VKLALPVNGELTIMTAAEQHGLLQSVLSPDAEVTVDLSAVTDLDTAGLQVLLLAAREAARVGARLTFARPSASVVDVLAVAHLDVSDLDSIAAAPGEA
jgi:anti-anti-sigma factor